MKNTFIAVVCCIFAVMIIPLLNVEYKKENVDTVRVLNTVNNTVYNMDLEYYVTKVLAKEMSPVFEKEALKAQAVAIRTFVYKKLSSGNTGHINADVCTDYKHCMAYLYDNDLTYGNKKDEYLSIFKSAVIDTEGEIITYNGEVASVYFHGISAGKTQNSEDVWGGQFPYLTSVNSDFEKESENFKSYMTFTYNELSQKLGIPENEIENYTVSYFDSGYVDYVNFNNHKIRGEDIRKKLGLRSSSFKITFKNEMVCFDISGYGHGVGMSQNGANIMAKNGSNYKDILKHYYKGTEIKNLVN